jgi:hypothetical protein
MDETWDNHFEQNNPDSKKTNMACFFSSMESKFFSKKKV